MLSSLNGKIAFHTNESSTERNKNSFTCKEDFERMRKLVSQCDVVFHGAQSIESESGAFRVADLRQSQTEPEWIIFTRTGHLSFQSPFWKQEGIPKSIFYVTSFNKEENPAFRKEEKEFNFGKITCYFGNIIGLLQFLKNKNYNKAALLGGGKLNSAFWEQNLINKLYLTLSPFLVDGDNLPNLLTANAHMEHKLTLEKSYSKNSFVYLDYTLNNKI